MAAQAAAILGEAALLAAGGWVAPAEEDRLAGVLVSGLVRVVHPKRACEPSSKSI